MRPARVAVIGGGWAGIAAAVHARRRGFDVSLFEMAPALGGRARAFGVGDHRVDNGQHILIGAYQATLELMAIVGANAQQLLHRQPLSLLDPDGRGLQLPPGKPVRAFVRGLFASRGWTPRDRLALLLTTGRWALRGFRCDAAMTVAQLCSALPEPVHTDLVEPLCVAALNTPASQASATVFLRVLRDALFSGPGSADLLLPRRPLDELLPKPAQAWLEAHDVHLELPRRIDAIEAAASRWRIANEDFEQLIVACSANEAARLIMPIAPDWAAQAAALHYEPIVTIYLRCTGARLPRPMTVLKASAGQPAQFAFDLGAIGAEPGLFAFVISGARDAVAAGLEHTGQAVQAQALDAFAPGTWPTVPTIFHAVAQKRATFSCKPLLQRPGIAVAPNLWAAGDYVAGPYPATLEGAVRSGREAAARLAT